MNQQEQILNELLNIEAMLQSALTRSSRLRVQLQVNQIPKKLKKVDNNVAEKYITKLHKTIRKRKVLKSAA